MEDHVYPAVSETNTAQAPTPETDALDYGDQAIFPGPGYGQLWALSRRLERQRDELLAALESIHDNLAGLIREKRTAAEQACLDRAHAALAKAKP